MIAFTVAPPNHARPDCTAAGPVMFNGIDATIQSDPGDEDDGSVQPIRYIRALVAGRISGKLGADVRQGPPGVYFVEAHRVSITMKLQPTNPEWQCSSPHDPGDEDRGVLIRFAGDGLGFREVA